LDGGDDSARLSTGQFTYSRLVALYIW